MNIIVCGGRDFGNLQSESWNANPLEKRKQYVFIHQTLEALSQEWDDPSHVITGGAKGVDTSANEWAEMNYHWITCDVYPADWKNDGKKRAGPIRNKRMLEEGKPDLVVAFPGGKGTAHMVKIAKAAGVPVKEIEYESVHDFYPQE